MRVSSTILAGALAAGVEAAGKNYLGFNSGSTIDDSSPKFKADFLEEFKTAQDLNGAPGTFNSVRLYTNIQALSEDDPIEAFEAAIETDTNILLGVWASGTDNIDKELSALSKALDKWGSKFADLVIGISIGSEDLYRVSVTGIENDSGVGNGPDEIIGFIGDFKKKFANSALAHVPVGHVDTWDVWANNTNKAVIEAVDWIGVDEYPYYETGKGNSIKNAPALFDRAYQATLDHAGSTPVWVTETGWPATGPDWDEADASVENAKYYWDEIGCRKLFNKTPTFWYTLRDSNPANKAKFAITKNLSTKPLFDLTCPDTFDTPDESSTTSKAAATKTTSTKAATKTDADATETADATKTDDSTSSFAATTSSGASATETADSTETSGAGASETDATSTPTSSDAADATATDDADGAASAVTMSKAALAGLALVAGLALF